MCKQTEDELTQVARVLKSRLVVNALYDITSVDARTATLLAGHDLRSETPEDADIGIDPEVLSDGAHVQRMPLCPGPMLFFFPEGDKTDPTVAHAAPYLLNPQRAVREAALDYFDAVSTAEECMCEHSRELLARNRSSICSEESPLWRRAAVVLFDALQNDVLLNLAGIRQSLESHFDDGLREHLEWVLHPPIGALSRVGPEIRTPSTSRDEVDAVISRASAMTTLSEACSSYYSQLGHLPLGAKTSMGEMVSRWLAQNDDQSDACAELWTWANAAGGPLPRYHVCRAILGNPTLFLSGTTANFLEEVLAVASPPQDDASSTLWDQKWLLRCVLARHYMQYCEAHICQGHGEHWAVLAWWLAERVARLFDHMSPEWLQELVQKGISSALTTSAALRQFANPSLTPSSLRYATLSMRSPWSRSLAPALTSLIGGLDWQELNEDVGKRLRCALDGAVVGIYPARNVEESQIVYAFQEAVVPAAEAWYAAAPDKEDLASLRAFIDMHNKASDPEQMISTLRNVTEHNDATQVIVGQVLRIVALDDVPVPEPLWDCISSPEWFKTILPKLDSRAIESFIDSLIAMLAKGRERWRYELPHLMAVATEAAESGGGLAKGDQSEGLKGE